VRHLRDILIKAMATVVIATAAALFVSVCAFALWLASVAIQSLCRLFGSTT